MDEQKDKSTELNKGILSQEYAASIVQALAIAQKNKQITGPNDLQMLIAAGIETALEDFEAKLKETPKIEL